MALTYIYVQTAKKITNCKCKNKQTHASTIQSKQKYSIFSVQFVYLVLPKKMSSHISKVSNHIFILSSVKLIF